MVYLLECLQKTPPPVRTSICWDGFKYQKKNHSESQQTLKFSAVGRCSYLQRRKLMWTLFMSTCCWKEWRQWPSMEGKVRQPDDAMTMLLGYMCNCISSPVDVSLLLCCKLLDAIRATVVWCCLWVGNAFSQNLWFWFFSCVDQEERTKAIEAFKEGKKDVLVATDVASKGLDFPAIQHVVNYDMPEEIENYGKYLLVF